IPGSMLPGRMATNIRRLVLAQVLLGSPSVSPDGEHALYTRRTSLRSGYRRHLWAVPLDAGRARPLTSGDVRDSAPRVACEGETVFFLRGKQVWAVPLAGGDPEQVTALAHGVSAFE